MADERELREWEKNLRQSRRALPVQGALALAWTALLVAVHVYAWQLHWTLWAFLLALGWFGFVGDLVNIVALSRAMARAKRPAASSTP
jgi:hypothetical protein